MSLSTTIWELVSCSASWTEPGHNGLESEAAASNKDRGTKGAECRLQTSPETGSKVGLYSARAATAGRAQGGRGGLSNFICSQRPDEDLSCFVEKE